MAKNIIKSKTFWLNVVGVGLDVAGFLPGGPLVKAAVMGGLNIATRIMTEEPVTILPQEEDVRVKLPRE